jgi:holliday junction DNA helicase RuvA
MFNSINGTLTHKGADRVYLDTGGVEWDLQMASTSIAELPDVGTECRLFVHVHHRDDQMKIFGFTSQTERSVFMDLLKVSGIGPTQAVKILSGMSLDVFIQSLDAGDVASLRRIPGLGEKTAQKIVLALRGKLTIPQTAVNRDEYAELIDALVEMGYDRKTVRSTVEEIAREEEIVVMNGKEREKEMFRRAIVSLS